MLFSKSRLALLLTFMVLIAACGQSSSLTESESNLPSFVRDGDWAGEFDYEYDEDGTLLECTFYPAEPGKGQASAYPFECGVVLVGLKSGVQSSDLNDLWDEVDADPGVYLWDWGDNSTVGVTVPEQSEANVLPVINKDGRTRYASLNFTGPASCGLACD